MPLLHLTPLLYKAEGNISESVSRVVRPPLNTSQAARRFSLRRSRAASRRSDGSARTFARYSAVATFGLRGSQGVPWYWEYDWVFFLHQRFCDMSCICHGKRSVFMGLLQKASVRPGRLQGNPCALRLQQGTHPGSFLAKPSSMTTVKPVAGPSLYGSFPPPPSRSHMDDEIRTYRIFNFEGLIYASQTSSLKPVAVATTSIYIWLVHQSLFFCIGKVLILSECLCGFPCFPFFPPPLVQFLTSMWSLSV